jgi:hypothetical protein
MALAKFLKHEAFLRGIVMISLAGRQYSAQLHDIGALSSGRISMAA